MHRYVRVGMCDSRCVRLRACPRAFTCDSCFTPWPLSLSRLCTRLSVMRAIHTPNHVKTAEAGRQKKRHILSILHTPPSCCFSSLSAPPDASSHLLHMRWELRTRCWLSFVNCLYGILLIYPSCCDFSLFCLYTAFKNDLFSYVKPPSK